MLRKTSIHPDFPAGAPPAQRRSVWFKGQRVGQDRNGKRRKAGRGVGKKNVRNKQKEEREGSVMTKGQIKVILQRTVQCIIGVRVAPRLCPIFRKKLWLSNDD